MITLLNFKKSIFSVLLFVSVAAHGQQGFKAGDTVPDFAAQKVLNYSAATASFQDLKGTLTILDFFGTWCLPCRRALPKLMQLQQAHKEDVKIILVSIEEEAKLKTFLTKQNDLSFPIVVDESEKITGLFQPPSLPYTVVIDGAGKILSITEAESINEAKIAAWLMVKETTTDLKMVKANDESKSAAKTNGIMYSDNSTVKLSQDFIYAAKTGESAAAFMERFKKLDYNVLKNALTTDDEKKAFWINLYNGFTQVFLKANADAYKNLGAFFSAKKAEVAGRFFSLDDIEHGILRRSKIKWSYGHLKKLAPGKMEKELRVAKVDYRIHFALNCGAKSCPPIAYYVPEKAGMQLDLATKNYLTAEAEYDQAENKIYLPAIMGWFRRDFGGKRGMKKILKQYDIIPADADPKISFKKYDWTLFLNNYKRETE